MKEKLIKEFNSLGISNMEIVTDLYEGKGDFVNLEFPLPGGQIVKLWDDEKTYFINQIEKKGTSRCYGLTADEKIFLFANMVKVVLIPKSYCLSVGIKNGVLI